MTVFCSSGNTPDADPAPLTKAGDRKPFAAGRFYTSDSTALHKELQKLFAEAPEAGDKNVRAIICPHAGYMFSGDVAASAWHHIDTHRSYSRVFVIASSHRHYFNGASLYHRGDYITPLGRITVDTACCKQLIEKSPLFGFNADFHLQEHSLEVQLPFLQYRLGGNIQLVPIIIGTDDPMICKQLADILKPYFTSDNLFVISTDFSHFPSYNDAVAVDKVTMDAICSGDVKRLQQSLQENIKKEIKGLETSLCGLSSVLTLLYMAEDEDNVSITPVLYKNSGDSPHGEKDRVVGYASFVVTQTGQDVNTTSFWLSQQEAKELLLLARQKLTYFLLEGEMPGVGKEDVSGKLSAHMGAFVTLRKDGALRGCIGRFTADEPLYSLVQKMAVAAATQDTRFEPVTLQELSLLHIEISVLTPLQKIKDPSEIILGKHGIYMRKGYKTGTFLPQVATDTGWTLEEFLGHCSRDKAGIGWDGWKDAELYIYEALIFEE